MRVTLRHGCAILCLCAYLAVRGACVAGDYGDDVAVLKLVLYVCMYVCMYVCE